jgi:hypothetical protein
MAMPGVYWGLPFCAIWIWIYGWQEVDGMVYYLLDFLHYHCQVYPCSSKHNVQPGPVAPSIHSLCGTVNVSILVRVTVSALLHVFGALRVGQRMKKTHKRIYIYPSTYCIWLTKNSIQTVGSDPAFVPSFVCSTSPQEKCHHRSIDDTISTVPTA